MPGLASRPASTATAKYGIEGLAGQVRDGVQLDIGVAAVLVQRGHAAESLWDLGDVGRKRGHAARKMGAGKVARNQTDDVSQVDLLRTTLRKVGYGNLRLLL